MSLNDTPTGDRIHIGFFGRRNAGKSSIVNAVTGQDAVGGVRNPGTTTDPGEQGNGAFAHGPGDDHRHPGL